MSRPRSLAAAHVVHAQTQCRSVLLAATATAGLPVVATNLAWCPPVHRRIQVTRHIARTMEHASARAGHSCELGQASA